MRHPTSRPLENGDIINIDITVFFNGYHGDTSQTFLVGDVVRLAFHYLLQVHPFQFLIRTSKEGNLSRPPIKPWNWVFKRVALVALSRG